MRPVILFDGMCSFCDHSVQFIMKRDPDQFFSFAALQSDVGKALMENYDHPGKTDSLVFIDENGVCYRKSSAALHVAKHLRGMWKLTFIFIIVPKRIRDYMYDQFSKRRYKWFGKKESCKMPTPKEKSRFL